MLKTLKSITREIVDRYDPDSIILYGSYAAQKQRRGSDIDLFIIKETPLRALERRIEVEKILAKRTRPVDILVYTPAEVRYLYQIGSPFINEIMEKGRLLYMRKATIGWIGDVEEEFDSAKILFEHKKYRSACYHSQQCVEKGLKTLIIEKGKNPPRIHDIVELLNRVNELKFKLDMTIDDAVFLNSVYKGRYPLEDGLLPHGEPSKEDAERAVNAAERTINQLKRLFTHA
jgi:uncharacterized protein